MATLRKSDGVLIVGRRDWLLLTEKLARLEALEASSLPSESQYEGAKEDRLTGRSGQTIDANGGTGCG